MTVPLRRALAPALAALACAAGSAVPAYAHGGPSGPPARAAWAGGAGSPQLVRDPDGVPVVARYDVAAYGADASGRSDSHAAIQRALDAAGADGGGVVWIGAGSYRVATPLWVPRGVTLLGDWRDPQQGGRRSDRQTVLLADPDPASQTPFLTLVGGGGVQGLNVYYPRQRADQPLAYAPTVRLGGGGSQFASVKQVTLVNPYEAIRAGTDNNELGILDEVRISPLRRGITIDFATDVGRIEDVSVSPRFWAAWDGTSERAIAAQSRANVIGLDIGRSDTQYVKGLEVTDAAVGVRLRRDNGVVNDVTTSSSGQYSDLDLRRVGTGVRLDDVNTIAAQLTHARIDAEQAGIATGEGFSGTTFNCQDCAVTASQGPAVDLGAGSDGVVGLYASSLRGAANGPAAIVSGGALQLQRSLVQRPRRGAAVQLRSGAGALDLVDTNLLRRDVSSAEPSAAVTVDHGLAPLLRPAPKAPRLPALPRPRGSALIDATAAPYSADRSAGSDATAAIQRALDATARSGGGITYLPAGRYRLAGSLNVPSGVELRGAQITPFHTNAAATVLYVTGGAGRSTGPAAVTVQARAGLSGLLTWYPQQSADAPAQYPYAVRVAGRDAWVRMVDVGNAWQGVDAASADTTGHQLDWVVGAPLKTGIALGRSDGGVVRRTHFNPHFWFRTTDTTLPGAPADWDAMMALFFKIMKIQDTNLDAFLLGSARNEVIDQAFAYRQKVGAHFVRQDGRGFEGLLYGFWLDAAVDSYVIEGTGPRGFDCVNCDAGAVPWGFDATRGEIPTPAPGSFSESFLRLEPGAGAATQARFFNFGANAFNWNAFRGVVVRDGSLQLAQAAFSGNPRDDAGALQLLGGATDAVALSFNRTGRIAADNVSFLRQPVWTDVFVGAGVRHAQIAGAVARDGVKNVLQPRAPGVRVRGEVVLR
ncbi:glycosyl hydrolase family 28-related protein [Conexibacter sp. JD483]|uniref:glycosyl hydrolase family 28-related protein n=1 Tax=unclassified Conexibacter TaxID=2627773 RepID=UPI002716C943|nr:MULTISPECIES: glycosyl hydrolase family 28-related protein [unclassified Conexibacter]MDO8187585.1 glycosyl hydrolase family 28-related protein [Conexibacter sp. CPCC 205706]MDO8198951.1 glycosyl hydrolase family 28-related protein [Conexibacter sp. CPCC 205762]MDR9370342.1 glycosyl hydrolase family 28-related protein [Conexibacter sp. JD483]